MATVASMSEMHNDCIQIIGEILIFFIVQDVFVNLKLSWEFDMSIDFSNVERLSAEAFKYTGQDVRS